VPGLQRPGLAGRRSPTGPGAPGGRLRSQQHAGGPGEQSAAKALGPASVLAAWGGAGACDRWRPSAAGAGRAQGGGRGGGRVSAPPPAPAGTLAAAGDSRGGMAEAGGAGSPALPPAPPHGSPRTLATAAGSSASCGPATAVAAAGTAEGPGGGGSARIAVKKAQLRSAPRAKKLEKLGVYSACKVPAGMSTIAGSRAGSDPPSPPPPTPSFPPAPRKCCVLCARSAAAACTASHWDRGRGSSRSAGVPLLGRMSLGFGALGTGAFSAL
jgi:hypothetical protein